MIFLIPERSSSLAILVPSYMSLQKKWHKISSGILLAKENRNSKSPTPDQMQKHYIVIKYHKINIVGTGT
jgi:hypothetical protein